ncbi:Anp1-domain-containing protein [Chlamydoabsidia padenii]|nr:Anp1-domain-containing protein [Chlamydoabsidia padenii]
MSFSLNAKGNKRLIVFAFIFVLSFFYFMPTFIPHRALSHKLQVPSSYQISEGAQVNFKNLNSEGSSQQEQSQEPQQKQHKPLAKILVLTPLKDAVPYLDRYFELLDETTYPNHLISLAFLVSDTTDNTIEELHRHANTLQNRFWWNRFNDIRVFQKDFKFDLPNEQRHKYEMQPLRRSIMARSRNYLLTSALRDEFDYVAWVDVDVVKYPTTIFEDLIAADEDVVVPNCLLNREDGSFWSYDKNNWQETQESLELQKDLDDDFVLLEGYYEFPTHRYLMVDMPTHLGKDHKVPLDGVGATFTLVKADVHREGANFPAYPFHHQVETEGFAKMAKAMGFSVVGLPSYLIYHIENH